MPHHRSRHAVRIHFLAFDIVDGRAFGLGGDNVAVDGLCLPEPPETTDGLIELLKAIVQADKYAVAAMLPVEAVAKHGRLTDQDWRFAVQPALVKLLFLFLGVPTVD